MDFTVGKGATGRLAIETSGNADLSGISESYDTPLLTDKLMTALTRTKKVDVVERRKIEALLEELDFSQADVTDPNKTLKLGKLFGAEYLVLGSLSMLGGNVQFETLPYNAGRNRTMDFVVAADLRLVQTETGKVIFAKNEKVTRREKKAVQGEPDYRVPVELRHAAYDQLVTLLVNDVINTLFPIKVARFVDGVLYLNRGQLKPGTQCEVLEVGELIRDPDTKEILGQVETKIAIAEITETAARLSKAKVVKWLGDQKDIPPGTLCRPIPPKPKAKAKEPTKAVR